MRYRRRLRSRIIISFALFGLGLTALFAAATVYLRTRLEDQLINSTLMREVKHFVDFKRENPDPGAQYPFSAYSALIVRPDKTAIVPFAWQKYAPGVYDIEDIGRGTFDFALAVGPYLYSRYMANRGPSVGTDDKPHGGGAKPRPKPAPKPSPEPAPAPA